MGEVVPNGEPDAVEPMLSLEVASTNPDAQAQGGKPVSGLGAGAMLFSEGELPSVLFQHGGRWVVLQGGFDIEATQAQLNVLIPKLVSAAHQVYSASW